MNDLLQSPLLTTRHSQTRNPDGKSATLPG